MLLLKRVSLIALILGMLTPYYAAAQKAEGCQAPAVSPGNALKDQAEAAQNTAASQPAPQPGAPLPVECVVGDGDKCTESSSEMLGHHLKLKVVNLKDWAKNNSPWKLILFLNGRPLPKTYPVSVDPDKNQLIFKLQRTTDSEASWDDLIIREKNWKNWLTNGVSRCVRPSVAMEGSLASETHGVFKLELLSTVWVYVCITFWLGTLIALIVLAQKSSLLRDNPGGPFSLARTQMAVWSWVLLSAYFFLFVMTWDPGVDIPVSMLGLLGISATTYVAATLVDRSGAATPTRAASKGFWKDICGSEGVSLHRIQIIAWTVVLVFVFIVQVFTKLAIPVFDPTLLGLLGVSAGTYVGFKFPENQTPAATPATPDAAKTATAGG